MSSTTSSTSNASPANRSPELVIRPDSKLTLQPLRDIWQSRELLWILALRDVKVRYKQAFLGVVWAVLQPVVQVILFTVLFHRFAGIRSGSDLPYPVFCCSGLVVWTVFASGLSHASDSLISNSNLVTKVYFPRAVLPIAAIGATLVDFAIGFLLLVPVSLWFHVPLSATAILAPLLGILAALCAVSIGLWTSAINLQYRDVRYALPFFMQLLVFVTPVFYPTTLIPERFRPLLAMNPMAAVVDCFRAALYGQPPPWARLAVAMCLVSITAVLGFFWFRSHERTFADRV
jgi:lipopolysaccharide transport system permease protein